MVSIRVVFPAFEIDFEAIVAAAETGHSPSSVQTPAVPKFNYKRPQAGNDRNLPPGVSPSVHHLAVHRWPLRFAMSTPDHAGIAIAIPVRYLLPASVRNRAHPNRSLGTVTTRAPLRAGTNCKNWGMAFALEIRKHRKKAHTCAPVAVRAARGLRVRPPFRLMEWTQCFRVILFDRQTGWPTSHI